MVNQILNQKKMVVVGMSGGVDSSVSAALLKAQGYQVVGVFMKNWNETDQDGHCTSDKDYADVVKVCQQLDIPYYSIDFSKQYHQNVFEHFVQEYRQGYTPNPDILCNREIKFKVFFDTAMQLGADYLATGHYCQVATWQDEHQKLRYGLKKGLDLSKDQSYFLYTIKEEILKHVLFPIGHLLKSEVRELAHQFNLTTHNKKDSTGICFIGERNFTQFLGQYIHHQPGAFKTLDGEVVGEHRGISFYTIGQRKGLMLGGAGRPWFVSGKNIEQNEVYVVRGENHPALFANELWASDISWINSHFAYTDISSYSQQLGSKIRYRQKDVDCRLNINSPHQIHVQFSQAQRAITPRQSIVFYQGDLCLGGGIIEKAGPNLYEQGLQLDQLSSFAAPNVEAAAILSLS